MRNFTFTAVKIDFHKEIHKTFRNGALNGKTNIKSNLKVKFPLVSVTTICDERRSDGPNVRD